MIIRIMIMMIRIIMLIIRIMIKFRIMQIKWIDFDNEKKKGHLSDRANDFLSFPGITFNPTPGSVGGTTVVDPVHK